MPIICIVNPTFFGDSEIEPSLTVTTPQTIIAGSNPSLATDFNVVASYSGVETLEAEVSANLGCFYVDNEAEEPTFETLSNSGELVNVAAINTWLEGRHYFAGDTNGSEVFGTDTITITIRRFGQSEPADTKTITVTINPPALTSFNAQTGGNSGEIDCSWTPTGLAETVEIERSLPGAETWTLVASPWNGDGFYTDSGPPGGERDYRARLVDTLVSGNAGEWTTIPNVLFAE